jgi:hypothetical protein
MHQQEPVEAIVRRSSGRLGHHGATVEIYGDPPFQPMPPCDAFSPIFGTFRKERTDRPQGEISGIDGSGGSTPFSLEGP